MIKQWMLSLIKIKPLRQQNPQNYIVDYPTYFSMSIDTQWRALLRGEIARQNALSALPWAIAKHLFVKCRTRCQQCLQSYPQHIITSGGADFPKLIFKPMYVLSVAIAPQPAPVRLCWTSTRFLPSKSRCRLNHAIKHWSKYFAAYARINALLRLRCLH